MAEITRTTEPLDAEVILPGATLSVEQTIFKEWQETFVAPNPLDAQVDFFKNLAVKIRNEELDVEFYLYWYNRAKTSHPVVIDNLPLSATPEYQDINESVGTLWFAEPDTATTSISEIASTELKPYPTSIETLLPIGVSSMVIGAYTTVNTPYAANIANIQANPSTAPTAAHGDSLVKDTIANTRNNSSKSDIQTQLESKYGVVLDLTEIESVISGDITVPSTLVEATIEGVIVTVDELGNKVDPTESTLSIDTLQAQ